MKRSIPTNDVQLQFSRDQAVTLDYYAFTELIAYHGASFVHYRAMRCPIGLIDKYDVRRPDSPCASNIGCQLGCSNGFVYRHAGCLTGVFLGNPIRENDSEIGFIQDATAQLTIPEFYDNSDKPIHVTRYDRLYLAEEALVVQHWELAKIHETGIDRLSFPCVEVIDLIDSAGLLYTQSSDFVIENGKIKWTGQRRPSGVYSVRYTYRPYWYVKYMPHELRISQANVTPETDPTATEFYRKVKALPQTLYLQREYVFEKEIMNNDQNDFNPRALPEPRNGGFGPR